MGKLLLTGVDGNLGAEAAKVLMELEDKMTMSLNLSLPSVI